MTDWQTARENSGLVRRIARLRDGIRTALATSLVVTSLASLRRTLRRAAATSWLARALGTLSTWTRHSWLFRWLTAEPDPDVIVIDLRETWTVGPILAALDWLSARVARVGRHSYVGTALQRTAAAVAANPVSVGSLVVAVAVVGNLFVTAVLGSLTPVGFAVRLVVLGTALVGTQAPSSALERSTVYRLAVRLVTPPELEETSGAESERRAPADSDTERRDDGDDRDRET